ncbi:protein translocase subunit SecDF [Siphonobacter curvatus]|uniref:Multifunctional fusion protein n=1 Tax=Siphonobacter curvatus TaxID=2094562 RepID=A0A2S7IKF2_9BACT|nr:protein translocase subunit SecDF [Siphonobacter curvatus]PQA58187.1 protein translocase subunit SecDF [Siphonobacter curvatus]
MQNRGVIVALTGIFAALCLYYLSFTFVSQDYKKKAIEYATDPRTGEVDKAKKQRYTDSLWKEDVWLGSTLQQVTERELNLGLDLQGGMHVILEVSPVDIIKSLAGNSRDPKFLEALAVTQKEQGNSQSNFVDAFARNFKSLNPDKKLADVFANATNRATINFQTSDADVVKMIKTEVDGAVERAFRVIQQRVDKFGVSNPNIQRIPNSGRIQVELAGVDDPARVRKLLTGSAKLEFCEVYELQEYAPALDGIGNILLEEEREQSAALKSPATQQASVDTAAKANGGLASALTKKDSGAAKSDTTQSANAGAALTKLFIPMQDGLGVAVKDTPRVNALLARNDVRTLLPSDLNFAYEAKPRTINNKDIMALIAVKRGPNGEVPLDGSVITNASQDYDQSGRVDVSMQMNPEGARKWKNLTAANIGRRIAILLDGYVQSAPVVNGEIPNGNSSISGNFTLEEGKDLATVLKAGKLPAPTTIVEEAVVGSTLGSEAVNAGILSSVVGLFVVLMFMLAYYNRSGFIADIALLVNLFFLMGIMASLGSVLTLPGIAGIVLSIGMAVDANVLVFERIKEELALGKPMKLAVSDGFKNATSSIIDSNATTLLSGLILLFFGTGLILGFAVTLVIGIFTSLFAVFFVSRALMDIWVEKGWKINFVSNLTKNWFKDSDFDFVSKRRLYYTISSVIIAAGILSVVIKGFGLGVDFKGGRTYVVRFDKSISTDEVRTALEGPLEGSPEVKTYGGSGIGGDQVQITTDYLVDQTTVEADREAQNKIIQGVSKIGKAEILSSSKVGPTIANDMIFSSLYSILAGIAVVFGYILLRFKKLAFGYGAMVAVSHDVLIILAIFSIFNGILPFSLDVDQSFVGALLTIMGYSMNDTVVVFDRVREYLREGSAKNESIPTIINNALNSTLSRTAVTGLSTMLVLIVLFFFGGETIRGFSFAMLIGVIVGTYSSLFVATPIVVDFLTKDQEQKGAALEVAKVNKPADKFAVPSPEDFLIEGEEPQAAAEKAKKEKKDRIIKPKL